MRFERIDTILKVLKETALNYASHLGKDCEYECKRIKRFASFLQKENGIDNFFEFGVDLDQEIEKLNLMGVYYSEPLTDYEIGSLLECSIFLTAHLNEFDYEDYQNAIITIADAVMLLHPSYEYPDFSTETQSIQKDSQFETEKNAYSKIEKHMVELCFNFGKLLYEKNFEDESVQLNKLARVASSETGMNINSARIEILRVKALLSGQVYKRSISAGTLNRYLTLIKNEYGNEKLQEALQSVKKLIELRKELNLTSFKVEKVCNKFIEELNQKEETQIENEVEEINCSDKNDENIILDKNNDIMMNM